MAKVCKVCGHEACECCGDWCDNLILDEWGNYELCCGGKCTYG